MDYYYYYYYYYDDDDDDDARMDLYFLLRMRRLKVVSIRSFGIPLTMNEMHKTRFDHARFDPLPFVISQITRVLSICQIKLTQKQGFGANAFDCVWTSDRCRPHSTFTSGYY